MPVEHVAVGDARLAVRPQDPLAAVLLQVEPLPHRPLHRRADAHLQRVRHREQPGVERPVVAALPVSRVSIPTLIQALPV